MHEKLEPADLAKYSAVILPNTALLTDEQRRRLRAYVDGGGSLLATFETSLYDERYPLGEVGVSLFGDLPDLLPELPYPVEAHTTEPAVVIRQKGSSRLVYFPGDIERTMWKSGHTDLGRLLQNSIRWSRAAMLR